VARRNPLADADYAHLAELRAGLRRFLRFSEDAARGAGLTPSQHQALLAVRGSDVAGGPTIGELARRLQVRHHSAVGLVDRLVGLGLLRKRRSRVDRRNVALSVTARGERILASLSAAHREELRRLAPQLRMLLERIEAGDAS
jgi:DNA-binding MarR family transcriptional regulator